MVPQVSHCTRPIGAGRVWVLVRLHYVASATPWFGEVTGHVFLAAVVLGGRPPRLRISRKTQLGERANRRYECMR